MICSKCGQECSDDMLFCTNCGEKLSKEVENEQVASVAENANEVQEETKEKEEEVAKMAETVEMEAKTEGSGGKSNKKLIGLAIGGVALLAIILIVVLSNLGGGSYIKYTEKSINDIEEIDGKYCVVYMDGKTVELDEEPDFEYGTSWSMDDTVVAYLNDDEELVIFANGKEIATGIDEVSQFQVSALGDTVVYFTDCEYKEFKIKSYYDSWYEEWQYTRTEKEVGTLNVYDVKKKKSEEIADEVCVGSVVLSPDGKTVAYVADYDVNEDGEVEYTGYYSVNGKDPKELGDEKTVLAISDGAKYIYYADEDRLYALAKKKEVKLASDGKFSNLMLNEDYSELLYVSEGKTYIVLDGKEEEKACKTSLSSIMLKDDAAMDWYDVRVPLKDEDYYDNYMYVEVTYTGVDTFKEKLFYGNGQVHYMLKRFETEKIASDVSESDCVVADDGKSMVYLDGNKVMKVTKFAKGGEKEKLESVSKAMAIFANGDLSMIFVVDSKYDLHYVKKNKDIELGEDLSAVAFSPDGKYFYYVEDGDTLFCTTNGKKAKEIFSVDDGELDIWNGYGVSVLVEHENDDDDESIMYRVKGKKVKELFTIEW